MKIRFNWGVGVALVYIAFVMGTVSVVILASTRHVDLVSEDYYQRSLSFDRQIDADERGRAAGVHLEIEASGARPRLVVTFPGTSPMVARGTVTFYRPSGSRDDRTVPLRLDVHRQQSVDLAGLPSGHWQAQLRWVAGGQDHYLQQNIVTP